MMYAVTHCHVWQSRLHHASKELYLCVPLAHVIGKQLHVPALADHHLLRNKLENWELITVSSSIFLHLVQLSLHFLSLISDGTC